MQKAVGPGGLVDLARKGFGGPPDATNQAAGMIWDFPHDEARDLTGRIFGDAFAEKYNPIKSMVPSSQLKRLF